MGDFFMRFSKKMVGLLGVCLAVGIIIASFLPWRALAMIEALLLVAIGIICFGSDRGC